MGSWQQREVDIALDLQSKSPNSQSYRYYSPLGFLRQLTWVDLRTQTLDREIAILIKRPLSLSLTTAMQPFTS